MREVQEKENPYASDSQSRLDFIKNKLLAGNLGQSAATASASDAKSSNGDDEGQPKKGKTVTLE